MKFFTLTCFIFFSSITKASNYYLSSQFGDDNRTSVQAHDSATPWKTINRLNSFTHLLPGDSVLFKRGDTFFGSLLTNRSGLLGAVIFYGSYGTGANPKLTGLSELSAWTLLSGNIYYATLDVPELNVVTLDGELKAMGRYPKTGYFTYTTHSINSSISGNSIGLLPFDATGAEVVVRKIRQITDRHLVTLHSGNTLNLSPAGAFGTVYSNNTSYEPHDGNGYFIQSNINTLTEPGEWYYSNESKRLYMHFGSGTPAEHIIKASTVDYNSTTNNKNYITFQNIDFEGANKHAINLNNDNSILLIGCNFYTQCNAVHSDNGINNLTIQGGSITDILNDGILVVQSGNHVVVDSVTLNKVGFIAGAGGSGDEQQLGIWITGDNSSVKNCTLTNIGFHGIVQYGNNTLTEYNLIDTFCTVKDDAAAIYDFQNIGVTSSNKIIRYNTILNALGVPEGAPPYEPFPQAAGIYLDNSNNVEITGNTIAHGGWAGIWVNGIGTGNQIKNNLVYNFGQQIRIAEYSPGGIRDLTVTDNKFVAKDSSQATMYVDLEVADDISSFGTFRNNSYARPIDDDSTITINQGYSGGDGKTAISLAMWKTTYKLDSTSTRSHVTVIDVNDFRFDYNASNALKTITLNQQYEDINGQSYSDSLAIMPYSSLVLVKKVDYQVLPLTIINFNGKWMEKNIRLDWETSNETKTALFEIEKSSDGITFKVLDSVVSKNYGSVYTLTDYHPSVGKNFYRIKAVDKSGGFFYSKIIVVPPFALSYFNIFPNPTMNDVQVKFAADLRSKKMNLSIKNMQGAEIKRYPVIPSSGSLILNISFLAKGAYLLTLESDTVIINKQFIKL